MSTEAFLNYIAETARDPLGQIKKYKDKGRSVAGFLCSYVPEELVYASGMLPVRLLGRAANITQADKYLQTYCCSQVRAFMEDFLNSDYKDLDAVLFAQTCDTMQSFYDIFKKANPDVFKFNFNFPCKVTGDTPYKYALAELGRIRGELERHTGKPLTKEAFNDAVRIYNRNRELLDRLYTLHAQHPEDIPSVALLHAVMASMFADKKEVNAKMDKFLGGFNGGSGGGSGGADRKKLILIGSVNVNESVYEIADEYGAMIVDDDLCTGRRYFEGRVEQPHDEALVRRYMQRPHCAAKHGSTTSRGDYIMDLAKRSGAHGAVFLYLKFCDPHAFDYPYIRDMLEPAGVRTMHLEIEQSLAPSDQLRTRLQAFIETL